MESDTSWTEVAIGAVAVVMFFSAVIVAFWQLGASWRARMSVAREDAYRRLAEDAIAAQRQVSEALERTATELAELRTRTAEVERVLKEVG